MSVSRVSIEDRIVASYFVETPQSLEQAAEAIAGEQSSSTFVRVPGETAELRDRFGARVESVELTGLSSTPGLPGAFPANGAYQQGRLVLSWPVENIGPSLPALMTALFGNLSELRELSGVRLLDIDVPLSVQQQHPGPRFGISGTRRLTSVEDRPLIGAIVKPCVGLTPDETAVLVDELISAGVDFVKDDELIANPPYSPVGLRAATVMDVVNRRADIDGKKAMVAFNITDDIDAMRRHHDAVVSLGGTAVMVSVNSVGLSAVVSLAQYSDVPIHAHRNGWGALARCPVLGMDFRAYQKIWRLAGVDHLHVGGLQSKFWEPDDSVIASIRACLAPVQSGERVMPVVSSAQWGGQAPLTYSAAESTDLIYVAGGAILAHPLGASAGVRALRQAWEAAIAGVALEDYATSAPELAASLGAFGSKA